MSCGVPDLVDASWVGVEAVVRANDAEVTFDWQVSGAKFGELDFETAMDAVADFLLGAR